MRTAIEANTGLVSGRHVLIRVDGGADIGLGHLMRCLALAQAWRRGGGIARFLLGQKSVATEEVLAAAEFDGSYLQCLPGSAQDARLTGAAASDCDWLVLDGYQFDIEYNTRVRHGARKLLLIDDMGLSEKTGADIILNQNLHATESLYPEDFSYTRLLSGLPYALLRREFRRYASGGERHVADAANKVLLTFGGSDPSNMAYFVLESLSACQIRNLQIRVLVGAANPHFELLGRCIEQSPHSISLLRNAAMPEQMAWADIAIAAAGSTCWELAFMGLPGLLVAVADNQVPLAEYADEAGFAINLGDTVGLTWTILLSALTGLLADRESRLAMSRAGRKLLDGQGADRIVAEMARAL